MSNKKNPNMTEKKNQKKRSEHQPVLLDEDSVHYKGKPPYLLIGIVVITILLGYWKVYMANQNKPENNNKKPQTVEEVLRTMPLRPEQLR